MAGFAEQLQDAQTAHLAATAIELSVRDQISAAFEAWDAGSLDARSVRWQLERTVRDAYRTSAALASAHAQQQAGIPGWKPVEVFNTEYLQNLLADVRRNLREYKSSARDEKARRRAVLRMQHSAGVASQRGYTDGMISSYTELQDFGYRLRKVWMANFVNNTPCDECARLHGHEVPLDGDFPVRQSKLKVYGDLKGPPRHPRCRCYLAILIVSLDNALDALDIERPSEGAATMTSAQVRTMPSKIFQAVVKTLQKVVSFFRGSSNG